MSTKDSITIYLTTTRAQDAGVAAAQELVFKGLFRATYRVIQATVTDHFGPVAHGFKVLILPRSAGTKPFFL